jgi:hypothetical protein
VVYVLKGKYYKLEITITEVDDSAGWWFMSSGYAGKRTDPNGITFRCTGECPCQEEKHR